jgi:hypothetical protein
MKAKLLFTLAAAAIALAGIQSVQAQTSIKQLDADTIRVTEFAGKPPHKRLTIDRTAQPEIFAHYAERVDYDPQSILASERRGGAPGKNLPGKVLKVSSDPVEVAEFARFEEADAGDSSRVQRPWRGAPGKSRPISR